jgi:hypothetical protein
MGVRASQAYLSVVGQQQQDGEVRVRRMYVDVLIQPSGGGDIDAEATSNLSLNQTAVGIVEEQFADSTINFTDNAVAARTRSLSASSTLNFVQLGSKVETASGNNALSLNQTVFQFNYVDDRKPAGDTLNLTQVVFLSNNPNAGSTLALTQNVTVDFPTKIALAQPLGLSQSASTPVTYRESVSQALSFTQISSVPVELNVTHNLALTQLGSMSSIVDTLNLVHTAVAAKGYVVASELDVEHTVGVTGDFIRSIEDDLGIGHALTWFEDTPCNRKNYTPFQGDNTIASGITPPRGSISDPQGNTSDTFSLYTPYLGTPTEKVDLRAPELDNRDRNAYTRVNRETRGGKLIVYADPNWPNVRTMVVTVIGLTETEVDSFQSFTQNTIGNEIGVTDWEGQMWKGVITNPNEAAVQDGKERWTITFEFEGERLEVERPGNEDDGGVLDLSQSATAVIA